MTWHVVISERCDHVISALSIIRNRCGQSYWARLLGISMEKMNLKFFCWNKLKRFFFYLLSFFLFFLRLGTFAMFQNSSFKLGILIESQNLSFKEFHHFNENKQVYSTNIFQMGEKNVLVNFLFMTHKRFQGMFCITWVKWSGKKHVKSRVN